MLEHFIFKYDMQNWKLMVWTGDNVVGLIDVQDASMVLINKICDSIWILRWIVFGKQLVDLMNEMQWYVNFIIRMLILFGNWYIKNCMWTWYWL